MRVHRYLFVDLQPLLLALPPQRRKIAVEPNGKARGVKSSWKYQNETRECAANRHDREVDHKYMDQDADPKYAEEKHQERADAGPLQYEDHRSCERVSGENAEKSSHGSA